VPQSHGLTRTNLKPSAIPPIVSQNDLASDGVIVVCRIASSVRTGTMNVALSTRNATSAPEKAMMRPPTAGPIIWTVSGRMN
jgi:hypothetical protein